MSDQTPASGEPDEDEERVRPRHQSAAERRSSETVMIDSGNLGDLVNQAKAEPPPAEPTPPAPEPELAPAEEASGGSRNVILIVGVIAIVILAIAIAYLIYK